MSQFACRCLSEKLVSKYSHISENYAIRIVTLNVAWGFLNNGEVIGNHRASLINTSTHPGSG